MRCSDYAGLSVSIVLLPYAHNGNFHNKNQCLSSVRMIMMMIITDISFIIQNSITRMIFVSVVIIIHDGLFQIQAVLFFFSFFFGRGGECVFSPSFSFPFCVYIAVDYMCSAMLVRRLSL